MLHSISIAMALCLCNQTQREPLPRDEVVVAFKKWRSSVFSEFHVIYNVKRKLIRENGPYDYVILGTAKKEQPLCLHWGGEHAWREEFCRDITVANPRPDDYESQCIHAVFCFEGRMVQASKRKSATVDVGSRSTVRSSYLPEEELFLEILGFESRRQDIGITLRGYKDPHKYDVLKCITSPEYSMTSPRVIAGQGTEPQQLYRFELPGADSFSLSDAYGYAIVRRKWIWPDKSNGNGAFVEIENSNWSKVDNVVWIPFTSQIRYFAKPTIGGAPELAVAETLSVSSASTRTTDKLFLPKLQKGAVLAVPDGRPAITFRGDSPEDVPRYLTDLLSNSELADQERGRFWSKYRLLIIATVLMLVALAAWSLYRRIARKQEQ